MKGYAIICLNDISDPAGMAAYRKAGGPSLAQYGGRLLAGPAVHETVEGPPQVATMLIEFDSVEQAQAWYHSPEYQAAVSGRHASSTGIGVIMEGRA